MSERRPALIFSASEDARPGQSWYKSVSRPAATQSSSDQRMQPGHLLLTLAVSALADNLALESQPYLAHSDCHTQYDHVTVVKQGQCSGELGVIYVADTAPLSSSYVLQALHDS